MFWFQVIIEKILAGQTSASYEEIIDEMISDAWYMVAEYHLNLGPRDNLEKPIYIFSMQCPFVNMKRKFFALKESIRE